MSDAATASAHTVRGAFTDMVEDLDRIDALIFTTFQFAVPFFEDNILGPLANDNFKLSTLDEIQGASVFASETDLSVFYDGNVTKAIDKRATFDAFPVFLDDGAFHPKIVVVHGHTGGQPVVRLLVASANLTLSGWAKNIEAVTATTVDHAQIAAPLVDCLSWLFDTQGGRADELRARYAPLVEHLESLPERPEAASRLLVTIPGRAPSLMQALADDQPDAITLASPYFGPRTHTYFRENLGDARIEVATSRDSQGILPMLQSDVDAIASDPAAELGRLGCYEADAERFEHFKLVAWDDQLLIGSHNATRAAMGNADGGGQRNVEVSLLIEGDRAALGFRPFEEMPPGQPSEETLLEDAPSSRLPCRIVVTADWQARHFVIEAGRDLGGYSLRLPGIDRHVPVEECAEEPFTVQTDVALLEQRWFDLFRHDAEGRKRIHRGYINELHWRGFRREAVMKSLADCLDAWVRGSAGSEDVKPELLEPVSERVAGDREERLLPMAADDASGNLFQSYFRLFRASSSFEARLWDTIEEVAGDENAEVARLLHSAPGSLQRVLELVEEQMEDAAGEWSAYRFVLVHEVANLTERVRAALVDRGMHKLAGTLDPLIRRSQNLVDTLDAHPSWERVLESGNGETLTFILEELGYTDVL